ncbi:hypothetical protein ACLB1G_25875 [Oxalobacteraceae bacterium A2-2]
MAAKPIPHRCWRRANPVPPEARLQAAWWMEGQVRKNPLSTRVPASAAVTQP